MAQVAQPVKGLSDGRKALLGVRVALDRAVPRDADRQYSLESDLAKLGVTFDKSLDAYAELQRAASTVGQGDVHPLHLAFATMGLRRRADPGDADHERLREAAGALANPEAPTREDGKDHVDAVHDALASASAEPADMRWQQLFQDAAPSLVPELSVIEEAWCRSGLVSVQNEAVSRVETYMVVKSSKTLDEIAPAVLPDNWPHCNDFFCSLTRRPDRDDPTDTTGGNLSIGLSRWRGVYEERVGECPAGWFPDTFLLCTWDRFENQIILRYELAPRFANDRTVLRIDEGCIQVTQLVDKYEVSTLKYLLFDDSRLPGGGQALGLSACQLGWLDHALNQFTDCAATLSGSPGLTVRPGDAGTPGSNPNAGRDAKLQPVLARCEDHLRESATSTDAQLRKVMSKVTDGNYSLTDFVDDWGQAVTRAMRDGARLLLNQRDFAAESLELAISLAGSNIRDKRS